jgi:hypothetical protein
LATTDSITTIDRGSCEPLAALRNDVDAFMEHLLKAALAVKREQGLSDDGEAFDYTVSFLSGLYRALALLAREATVEAME